MAAGDGVALAIDLAARPGLWLVDGRDPAWPRALRRLELGGTPLAIAIDGRQAVVATDSELVDLDLSDPTAPAVLGREAIWASRAPAPVVAAALDGPRAALLLEGGLVLLRDRARGEPLGQVQETTPVSGFPFLVLTGEGFVVGHSHDALRAFARTDDAFRERWHVDRDSSNPPLRVGIDGERVTVLRVMGGGRFRVRLDRYVAPTGPQPRSPRLEPEAPPLLLDTARLVAPLHLSVDLATRPGRPDVLLHEGFLRVLPPASVESARVLETPALWPRAEAVVALAGRDDLLAVAGRLGQVDLMDVSAPDSPHVIGRWQSAVDPENPPDVRAMTWHRDRLWILLNHGMVTLDVTMPSRPRVTHTWSLGDHAMMTRHGHRLWVASETLWTGIDLRTGRKISSVPAPWTFPVLAMASTSRHVWVATSTNAGGTRLRAFEPLSGEALDPWPPRPLPGRFAAMHGLSRHLVALLRSPTAGAPDVLQVLDASDPADPRAVGSLDIGLRSGGAHVPAVLAAGDAAFVAFPSLGLLEIDLSVPEFPDERGRIPIAPLHAAASDGLVLHERPDGVWVGGWWSGLLGVRRGPWLDEVRGRLYLPAIGEP